MGLAIETRNGLDYISRAKLQDKADQDQADYIYRPRYRDVNYLARLLGPMFKGGFSVNRTIPASRGETASKAAPDGTAAALLDQPGDTMVFSGSDKEVERLKALLPQVDFALGEVVVRGVVYEVSTSVQASTKQFVTGETNKQPGMAITVTRTRGSDSCSEETQKGIRSWQPQ